MFSILTTALLLIACIDNGQGPNNWYKFSPACAGKRQSPVDIETNNVEFESKEIELNRYQNEVSRMTYELANNGHAAQITLGNVPSSVFLEVFGNAFKPWQFHFHWGSNDKVGSEHTLDGKQFSAEMHFVHVNKKYPTTDEALKHGDGLLVLGTFIKVCKRGNQLFEHLVASFDKIQHKDDKVTIDEIPLDAVMPEKTDDFYYYKGSLTTPGCNEAVLWVVYRDTLCISPAQLAKFRGLKKNAKGSAHGDAALVNNFRPVQKLYGRTIRKNFQ
eukprot:gene13892-15340_t